jgi:hypothetical protein
LLCLIHPSMPVFVDEWMVNLSISTIPNLTLKCGFHYH